MTEESTSGLQYLTFALSGRNRCVTGIAFLAAPSGYLSDAINRKWTKCLSGRLGLGLSVGTTSFVTPEYISEQTLLKEGYLEWPNKRHSRMCAEPSRSGAPYGGPYSSSC